MGTIPWILAWIFENQRRRPYWGNADGAECIFSFFPNACGLQPYVQTHFNKGIVPYLWWWDEIKRISKLQLLLPYWDDFRWSEKTCCHSNSIETTLGKIDVKNSQGGKKIMLKLAYFFVLRLSVNFTYKKISKFYDQNDCIIHFNDFLFLFLVL